jgi:DNA-binding response OmpR family regulator
MKKKILIIEDDAILNRALQDFLLKHESQAFEASGASNGDEGVRFAKERKPDLIILDIILPKKDGFEVLTEIKADPEIKETPVILLTNLSGLNDVQRALELGASTYLVKSDYKLEEVVAKIKEILRMI